MDGRKPPGRPPGFDDEAMRRMIQNSLSSGEGRLSLAAAMTQPLPFRALRDYTSVARKMLVVDPLPEPKCSECGLPPDQGAATGCHVCVVRHVLES